MRLSSLDLRSVMRVLDVSGKMSAPMAFKRGVALEVMQSEDMSDATLEALVDDDAQNNGDARSGLPRRTLRFRLAPRSAGGPSTPVGSSGAVGFSGAPPGVGQVGAGRRVLVGLGGAPPCAVGGSLVESPARYGGAGLKLRAGAASLSTGAALEMVDSRTLGGSASPLGPPEGSNTTRAAHQYRSPSGPPEEASAAGDDARPRPAAARAQPPAISGRGAVTLSVSIPGFAVREPVFTESRLRLRRVSSKSQSPCRCTSPDPPATSFSKGDFTLQLALSIKKLCNLAQTRKVRVTTGIGKRRGFQRMPQRPTNCLKVWPTKIHDDDCQWVKASRSQRR